jgi:magnesium-transporting ATPase (P-type)
MKKNLALLSLALSALVFLAHMYLFLNDYTHWMIYVGMFVSLVAVTMSPMLTDES